MNITRQIKIPAALGIWAAVCLLGAFAGTWRGLGDRPFAVALGAFAALFAIQLLLAADGVASRLADALQRLRPAAPLLPLLIYVFYAVAGGHAGWVPIALAAIYTFAPAMLLLSAHGRPPGAWQDYAAVLCIWLPPEFHFLQKLFPYPEGGLAHPLWAAFAMAVGLVAFLGVRRLDGVGYTVGWGRGWAFTIGLNFLLFFAVAAILGPAIGFIRFGPQAAHLQALPLTAVGILLFNAWPEEFLFRGLIQNLLSKNLRSEIFALLATAVIFGLAHINNRGFPNWRYVILATLAGLAYGQTWRKTGSIFASAIVHSLVNISWYALFRTL
jgi:membrane protease YdiL (CAAX protease family)